MASKFQSLNSGKQNMFQSKNSGKKKLLQYTPLSQRKPKSFRIPARVSGGATIQDSNYVLERISTRSYLTDDQETIKKISVSDSASGTNDLGARRLYLEEVLNLNKEEIKDYFEKRYGDQGVLSNLGKLMSDRMKHTLSWKRAFDPRLLMIDKLGARVRARLRFEGWYNQNALWMSPLEYKETPWYYAKNDGTYVDEVESLYNPKHKNNLGSEFINYHFNLGLGFGESMVFNPPFQYNDLDDPRTHPRYTKIGRVYVQKVLNHMPMLMVMPGKIKYHASAITLWGIDFGSTKSNVEYIRSDNWFTSMVSAAWMGITDVVGTSIAFATSIFTGGRLITFRQQINLFQRYFDNVVSQLANNMGLLSPTGIYAGRWKLLSLTHIQPGIGMRRAGLGDFGKAYRGNQMIAFMTSKNISCSETFSNSTRTNPLMEQLNAESSEAAAEAQTGEYSTSQDIVGGAANALATGDTSALFGGLMKAGKKLALGAAGLVSQLALIKGGAARIDLPEVWDSSSFSRSYSLNFDCYSPYGAPLCKLETWGIMLAFWLTATMPRQVGSFSYVEPFVLRIVMPGKFNINYGIVESLSIERGEERDDWSNTDNLPKTVKFSINIKDFQPAVLLPQASRSLFKMGYESLFPASGFAEYMATVSGLSLADQMDWKKRLGRAFREWQAGWRRRTDADIIVKSLFNIGIADRITGILAPYGDAFDRIEALEDKARLMEYADEGIRKMVTGLTTALGTDTGKWFLYPLRAIYRTVYNFDASAAGNAVGAAAAKLVEGFVKATGKIFKPSETQQGFNLDEELKKINENNLYQNKGNLDSLKNPEQK